MTSVQLGRHQEKRRELPEAETSESQFHEPTTSLEPGLDK